MRNTLWTVLLIMAIGPLRAQTSFTWNGSAGSSWANAANWTPNTGVPTAADHVTIVTAANAPVLDAARTVANLTVSSGSLDLNSYTLTTTGNGTFNGGTLVNGTLALNSPAGTMGFGATVFDVVVTGQTNVLRFSGATFHRAVTVTKTGPSNDYCYYSSTFNADLDVTITAGRLYLAYSGLTLFNGDIRFHSNGASEGIWIGHGSGSATLALGRTVTAGAFTAGNLSLRNFTQTGPTAQTLTLTGTSNTYLQVGTTFHGQLNVTSPGLYLNGATFQASSRFTKTGTNNEYSGGGNTFLSQVEYAVQGSGTLYLANTGADDYQGDILLNSAIGSGGVGFGQSGGTSTLAAGRTLGIGTGGFHAGILRLRGFTSIGTTAQTLLLGPAVQFTQGESSDFGGDLTVRSGGISLHGGTVHGNARFTKTGTMDDWGIGNCTFHGDLELNNTSSGHFGVCHTGTDQYLGHVRVSNTGGGSVRFGNAGGTGILADGRTITVGPGGFTTGLLLFHGFRQVGTTPQVLDLGPNTLLYVRQSCSFEGDVHFTAGGLYLSQSEYHGRAHFSKTGSSSESSAGDNIFHGTVRVDLLGSGNLNLSNTGSDTFLGDIELNGVAPDAQLRIGSEVGTSTLADGRRIMAVGSGFASSVLLLRGFKQLGTTPQALSLSPNTLLYLHPDTDFGADLTTTSGRIIVAGATFRGHCHFTKTSTATDSWTGANQFQRDLEVVNMVGGNLYLGNAAVDHYQGDLRLNNLSTGEIRIGNGTGGGGHLAEGRTISIGSAGFSTGLLLLRDFIQEGTTPQQLIMGDSARLYFYNGTVFNGDLTTRSGALNIRESRYNGTVLFQKVGATGESSHGGNRFSKSLEIVNVAQGNLYLADNVGDTLLGDLIVSNLSTGQVRFGNWADPGHRTTMAAGHTVRIGAGGFANGLFMLKRFIQQGDTPISLPLGQGASLYLTQETDLGGELHASAGAIHLTNARFRRPSWFTKTSNSANACEGGNVFDDRVEFTNTGSSTFTLANLQADQFQGDLIFNNTHTGSINLGTSGGGGVLAAGRRIAIGAGGFENGSMLLRWFRQLSATPQELALGANAILTLGNDNSFEGDVVISSARLYLNGTHFHRTSRFTKTGLHTDNSTGGNVFDGTAEFINASSSTMALGTSNVDLFHGDILVNSTANGQISFTSPTNSAILDAGRTMAVGSLGFASGTLFLRGFTQMGDTPQSLLLGDQATLESTTGTVFQGPVTATSGRLFLSNTVFHRAVDFTKTGTATDYSVGGNVLHGKTTLRITNTGVLSLNFHGTDLFHGDIELNCTGGGSFHFGQSSGSGVLAAGRTIHVGPGGFETGSLTLRNFTQVGTTPQVLLLGSAAQLATQAGTDFGGRLTSTSGRLYLNGSNFRGGGHFTKTGSTSDASVGGNVFHANTTLTLTAAGTLSLAGSADDQYLGHLELNNPGGGTLTFGPNTGNVSLAAGRTIQVGALGFSAGTLNLRRFTQLGGTAQSLLLGPAATLNLQVGTTFNGDLSVQAGTITITGCTFNRNTRFQKTGATNNTSTGGNLFVGTTEYHSSSAGIFYPAYNQADTHLADLLFSSTGEGGVFMGGNNGSVLVANGAVGVGTAGLSSGTLTFRNFTKSSSSATLLPGGVNSTITLSNNCVFQGDWTSTSGNLYLNGLTLHGQGDLQKTGTATNNSAGGNVFHGNVRINSAGAMGLGVNSSDVYHGNAHFQRLGSGTFVVGYAPNTTFHRNLSTVGSTGPVQFGSGSGRTVFAGTTPQIYSCDAAHPATVRNLTLAMTLAGVLHLQGTMNVSLDVAFTSGVVRPMATTSSDQGLLILANGSAVSVPAHANSHVDGFIRKIGNTAFSFPVGNAGVLAPVRISAPGSTTHHFTARYIHHDTYPTYDHTQRDLTLEHVSRCEYWTVDRTNSTTNVTVTLPFDSTTSCGVTDLTSLVVARWDGTRWKDHGNGGTTGTMAHGTVTTSGPVTAFSPFTLASRTALNPLPIELLHFAAKGHGAEVHTDWSTASEKNNDHFVVERSADGMEFELVGTVPGAGNSQALLNYRLVDGSPLPGISYYRLKQVDHDGTFTYGPVVPVLRDRTGPSFTLWPNPAQEQVSIGGAIDMDVASIEVLDAAGRRILWKDVQQLSAPYLLDVSSAPAGVLFVLVRSMDGQVQQQRLLKH